MKKESSLTAASASHSSVESRAVYSALISGVIGFCIGLLVFWGDSVSLFARGEVSLGFVATVIGSIVALITYLLVASKLPKPKETKWAYVKRHINTWSIALVHGLLAFLLYALLFFIVSQSFIDVLIDVWSASVLLALATGFVSYIVYLSAATMTSVRVSMLLATFLLSGTFISMLTASNEHWWDDHFSSLGAGGGVSGYAFNATLIIAGLVIVALSKYIADDFNKLRQQGQMSQKVKFGVVQGILTGIGISLACVGFFVYNEYPSIHNIAATSMAVCFLGIVLALPWLMPGFTKAFFIASYALFGALVVSIWLYLSVGYFNLTVFELVAAAIIFTWLVIFVRHVAAMLNDETTAGLPAKA